MAATNDSHIKSILKGGGLFTLGTLGSNLLAFVAGVLVIRLLTVEQYGDFALGNSTIALLSVICLAGIPAAMVKMASQKEYAGDSGSLLLNQILGSSVLIVLGFSALASAIVFIFADTLAAVFSSDYLGKVFKILAFTIPLTTLMTLINAYFRFKNDVKPKVIFQDLGSNGIRVLMLLLAVVFALNFEGILFLYLVSAGLSTLIYIMYVWRKKDQKLVLTGSVTVTKKLLLISLPVLAVAVLGNLNIWLVSAFTSYFHSAEILAYFSAPNRLAVFLPLPLTALGYIYLPQASKMTESIMRPQLNRLYESVAKWSMLISLPVFIYIFFEAEFIVGLLFGEAYLQSADVLRVVTTGYCISTLLGHNYLTLVALGASKAMLAASLASLLVLLAFSCVIIPEFGHLGAALALAVSQMVLNVYLSWKLYYDHQVSAFSRVMLKTLFLGAIGSTLILILLDKWLDGIFLGGVFVILAYLFVIATPKLFGDINDDDQQIYKALLGKLSRRK